MREFFLLLTLVSLLAACGLKAPLFLPEQKPAAAPPSAAAVSDPPADARKSPGSK